MSHADMNNCSGFNEAAAAFSWNSPKKAINPYLDPAEVAPVSALSNLITLYAADKQIVRFMIYSLIKIELKTVNISSGDLAFFRAFSSSPVSSS